MASSKFNKAFTAILISAVVAVAAFASTATASDHNAHQDHRGACARTTASIKQAVRDLQFNGVAMAFATKLGIKPFNGSVAKQLNSRLMNGHVAQATTTDNRGCDGHGNVFGAGKRTLDKDETVKFIRPAKYGPSDVRSTPAKGFEKVTITVPAVLPDSCSNLNTGKIRVYFYAKMHPKAVKKTKKVKKVVKKTPSKGCASVSGSSAGDCNTQTNNVAVTPKQDCSADHKSETDCNQTTVVITINNNCGNVAVGDAVAAGNNCNKDNPPVLNCPSGYTKTGTNPDGSLVCTKDVPKCTSNCNPTPPVLNCPSGYTKTGTNPDGSLVCTKDVPKCTSNCTPPPTDVCPNISGTQTTVPQGSKLDSSGNCVKDGGTTPPPPTSTPGPNPDPSPSSPSAQCFYSDTGLPAPTPADPLHPPANVVC